MYGPKVKTLRFVNSVSTAVLLAGVLLMTVQGKSTGNTPSMATAKAAFRAKCEMCHGPDGAGSAVGKSMNVPDFRSAVIQKKKDSELAEVIANGKNGMPSFKGSLDAGQIHSLVAYIRTFAAKRQG